MTQDIDHRETAKTLLSHTDIAEPAPDPFTTSLAIQAATVHALLAVEQRLAEMVEQQQLANLLTARAEKDESGNRAVPLLDWQLEDAEAQHVIEAITRIVQNGVA